MIRMNRTRCGFAACLGAALLLALWGLSAFALLNAVRPAAVPGSPRVPCASHCAPREGRCSRDATRRDATRTQPPPRRASYPWHAWPRQAAVRVLAHLLTPRDDAPPSPLTTDSA